MADLVRYTFSQICTWDRDDLNHHTCAATTDCDSAPCAGPYGHTGCHATDQATDGSFATWGYTDDTED